MKRVPLSVLMSMSLFLDQMHQQLEVVFVACWPAPKTVNTYLLLIP